MKCSPGPTPVAIVADATGVTDGNVDTQSRTYVPRSHSAASAGARPSSMTLSSAAGLSESMTARTSFLATASAEDPQAGVLLALAAPAAHDQHDEPDQRQERQRRQEDRDRCQ